MARPDIDLKHFRLLLIKLRDEIMEAEKYGSEETGIVELDQSKMGRLTRMDALQNQQMALEAQRRRKIKIRKIDAAWQRIESGEFGFCTYCDEKIENERLEFDPTAVYCIDCASSMDS